MRNKFIRRIEPAGTLLGRVTSEAAEQLGIEKGVPVYSSAGDQPCGCLGAGVYKPGMVGINGGTSCTIQGVTGSIPKEKYKFILEINPAGKYAPEVAIHSGVSMLMKWLKEKILKDDEMDWDTFYGLANKAPPGNMGLVNIPYFQGVEVPYWGRCLQGSLFRVWHRAWYRAHGKSKYRGNGL